MPCPFVEDRGVEEEEDTKNEIAAKDKRQRNQYHGYDW